MVNFFVTVLKFPSMRVIFPEWFHVVRLVDDIGITKNSHALAFWRAVSSIDTWTSLFAVHTFAWNLKLNASPR